MIFSVALATALFLLPSSSPIVYGATVSSTPAQTFGGIGGSGAWWPMDLYHFPESVRQNLSDMLFTDSGMGLSSYRYNVGSGGVNVSNPVRAIETFYVSPGVYNWSADAQGIYFLQQASDRGVPLLTMFANSAPAPLTEAKTSCNSQFVNGTGLEYGTFLADVAAHWTDAGISISYISPINEPDNNFGPSPCGQEGMECDANQRAEVMSGLYEALQSHGLQTTVGILADESSSLSLASAEYPIWLPEVVDQIAALVHHTYDFPSDASYTSYVQSTKAAYPTLNTWMSEICCSLGEADGAGRGWSEGYDPTINNALMFSGLVFQSLVLAGEPHYDFWTLVSNAMGCDPLSDSTCASTPNSDGWTDGVIYYDQNYASNGNYELYVTKHFWTYKHFGNFVKPGSQRLPISGSGATNTMMAVSSSDSYYIIAMNPNSTESALEISLPGSACATTAFVTSATEDFTEIAAASTSGSVWLLALEATSLTTYVFSKGGC